MDDEVSAMADRLRFYPVLCPSANVFRIHPLRSNEHCYCVSAFESECSDQNSEYIIFAAKPGLLRSCFCFIRRESVE